jgi:serine protease
VTGNELIRKLAKIASGQIEADQMPSYVVRFALEYRDPPSVEGEHTKLARHLGSEVFSLEPLEPDKTVRLGRFLILQFPGIARTFSTHALYDMANALREALNLVACEPDVGARIYGEPDARDLERTLPEGAIVDLWCKSNSAPPSGRLWALDAIRARQAWTLSPKKGVGVLVGQPDTGVAFHPELEAGSLALGKARNLIEGGDNPADPLDPSMANPGHGTATASAVISREAGEMAGVAPGALLAPIRCINDVKIFDGAPVAAAVNHARKVGCDVITMSLGGFHSSALAAAVADAVGAGIIVLAAAGNCVGFVVYPAFDDNVIAVAGVDVNDRPWKGTSHGSAVDVAAPAENIYIARRQPGDGGHAVVSAGQGTSFAVALTAGAAALWLSHHGRDAVRAEALKRGMTAQALFCAALIQSARRPAGWDAGSYGAGIVDAEALLKLALRDIVARAPTRVASPEGDLETIWRFASNREKLNGFDWAQHGAEATLLAAQAEILSRRARAGMEAVGVGVLRPSAEVAARAPAILRNLFGQAQDASLTRGVTPSATSNERLLKIVGKSSGGGSESAAAVTVETARRRLRDGHDRVIVDKLDAALGSLPLGGAALSTDRKNVTEDAYKALRKLSEDGLAAALTPDESFGIEALINIHDRPALRVKNGKIDQQDPLLGDWGGSLLPANHLLEPVLASVGRIDLDGVHLGTGFVVASGCIMTNRHVLEAIAEEFRQANGSETWAFTGQATINFAEDGFGDEKRFKILRVIAAGPNRINEIVDFAHLDMAVLEVETKNIRGNRLPGALPLLAREELVQLKSEILVAGYPARPGINALRDPVTGVVRDDVVTRLGKLFGLAYSVKYLSPGEIDFPAGKLDGDARAWVFAHDATTLGGNSGSWAIWLGEPFGVVGLHFGGGTLRANYAHGLAAVRKSGVLAAAGLEGTNWI